MVGIFNMKYINEKIILLFMSMVSGCSAIPRDYVEYPVESTEPYRFRGDGYIMGFNQIILAKRNTKICAIKYTKWEGAPSNKPGQEGYSRNHMAWQRYDLVDKVYRLTTKGTDMVSGGPMAGISFHLSVSLNSKQMMDCGDNFRINARPFFEILFNRSIVKNDEYNVELFPTNWTDFASVDLTSPEIKWEKFIERCSNIPAMRAEWQNCPPK
jgi:hypothetical protein